MARAISPNDQQAADFLSGGGAMGALMRGHDWGATPFGPASRWPQSLRSAVSIMLNSSFPIALYWGSELALLYNDAWSPIPGGKHPWALGRPGHEVWPEIWDAIGPLYDKVIKTGEGIWQKDELLLMNRHGYVEECYFNFTFSPVRGDNGGIDGIFNAVVETTDGILAERRLRSLSRMGERADSALTVEGATHRAIDILAENGADVPFAMIYLREPAVNRLVACAGIASGSIAAPAHVPLSGDANDVWSLALADESAKATVIPAPDNLDLVSSFWSEPIAEVVVVPIAVAGEERAAAFLVAGANPRRRVDVTYRAFFEQAAGHIGTAIATARAYESARQQAEALAEIDRAKTAFFSNVSHEFRTPLTLMLGPLEDALAEVTTPRQHSRLDMAHRNALRLLRLVNSLLDFSRIEAGRVEAAFVSTDLPGLTADLASSFRSAIDKAGLKLSVDILPLSAHAFVDRDMWEKIVLNLLSNAFKFTHEGEIAVGLHEAGGQVILTVRDTGVGIPAAELPKLFDRFHRVEGAKGRSFEGSGIGLALVQELVKLHNGTIEVESEEGRGTILRVVIPLGTAHLPADSIKTLIEKDARSVRAKGFVEETLRWLPGGQSSLNALLDPGEAQETLLSTTSSTVPAVSRGCVLLADDNADLREYIARLLRDSGYEVVETADGEAALVALRSMRPDVLVTDVMMPKLDGFGLLRAVRDDSKLRDLPVIMLSARAGEDAKVEGFDTGADDYLTKPFSARELLARVSANIKLARVRRESLEAIKASEERLRELNATLEERVADTLAEKRLFADIVEATDASVQIVDNDFRILAINAAATRDYEKLFGIRPVIGESLLDTLAAFPQEREAAHKVWSRVLGGEAFTEISWWGDEGRGRRAYDIRFRPLFDARGQQAGGYLFGQDVTDRMREQEKLAAAEEQLHQAQKMEAMGQLTGGVAHDFNNLLTPIVGALDMLQRKSVGGEREQRLISGAAQSADRAKTLVQRLLAFARRQPLQATAVDVAKLVSGMADLIKSTTGPQIRVSVETMNGLPPAKADPNQLEMALLNLAVNARDAMPNGGTLRITAGDEHIQTGHPSRLATGRYIRLSVADTGVGMEDAVLARAIEPFYSTKGVGKGTGLGLSMVHGLALQLGGALTIQSRRGVGTNVELWLPITLELISLDETSMTKQVSLSGAGTVLLVDDEELARASTAAMLIDLGYRIVEAGSAEEALSVISDTTPPDILMTDHLMPGMNGTDLARIVRSQFPGVRVLLVSGYADAEGVAPDLSRLTKPFRNDELAASLAGLHSKV